jgi:hypothetical protein
VGVFYAPRAGEGKQILQIKSSKSVDTIRGYTSTGLHERECVLPSGPQAGKPDPEQPVHGLDARPWYGSLVDGHLMAEGQDFQLHRPP